ncbi:MAG: hypothetical protein IJ752_01855 [Alphaproteobacteria bacterium]|nr:hypothetical protein [Alphaproteobacteria bacterium]
MKKLLLFAAVLLSGGMQDITVYHHYDVDPPASKARLYIEKPEKPDADFILKLMEWNNEPKWAGGACFMLSAISLGIIPSWESYEGVYKHSLTQMQTGKTVSLSDIKEKTKYYVGWFFLPVAFAPKTRRTVDRRKLSPWTLSILANAIKEAASLVYDKNSLLYKQTSRWPLPVKQETALSVLRPFPHSSPLP